ncbi:MAG: trypsin-like peptidase domain-containing protein [Candidatus Yanofskybacteria bacterium]|nr:trypsin-like peptidase domain-containing protein [Candidatus Yanofskybacteria bacterium]
MKNICLFLLIPCLFFMSSCGPNVDTRTVYQKEARYPQNFRSSVALFIRERNESVSVSASAFLIDAERGLFGSAKHFVGTESDGDCKIFFNGKVYDGFLAQVPAVTDIAVIKIKGRLDRTLPALPYAMAEGASIGDKVFVRGIHPHPPVLQGGKNIIPIFRNYYGIIGLYNEFVYDNLEAEITDLAVGIVNKDIGGSPEASAEIVAVYATLNTKEDHLFSFGGLSGGPVVNQSDQLVGIIASESPRSNLKNTNFGPVIVETYNILQIVPVDELKKLMPRLADVE